MDGIANTQLIQDLQTLAQAAAGRPERVRAENGLAFAQALQSALAEVSAAQLQAEQLAVAFATGDTTVGLHRVMASLQAASLSFEQMVQVRNKMVSAYQEIMNMQI